MEVEIEWLQTKGDRPDDERPPTKQEQFIEAVLECPVIPRIERRFKLIDLYKQIYEIYTSESADHPFRESCLQDAEQASGIHDPLNTRLRQYSKYRVLELMGLSFTEYKKMTTYEQGLMRTHCRELIKTEMMAKQAALDKIKGKQK